MATCSTSIFDEEIECSHSKRLWSFKLNNTNKEIQINGVGYKFDRLDEAWGMVVFVDANCHELVMPLDLFGRLHAMALSGTYEFKALI